MKCYERLLNYVAVSTPSDESVEDRTPSTDLQFDLANKLAEEMRGLGLINVEVNEHCFVYGLLPATAGCENLPALGLIAHMDTATAFSGMNVKPQVIENYDGGNVVLQGSGDVLSVEMFPHLPSKKGQTLITTDGTTLLGADDKAGIAEILTAVEKLNARGIAHGPIAVSFTPDEEIGLGIAHFDVERFGAKYAYTVDGGPIGEFSFENFNACAATVDFTGCSVHPGSAKDIMINACLLAMEFNAMLPADETPRDTEYRQGFFHLGEMNGDGVKARLSYIVRDHDAAHFEIRKQQLRHVTEIMNHRWGEGTVKLSIREQYRNMREQIDPYPFLLTNAKAAMEANGMTYVEDPIRGGTDGAQLSYRGLPCPNLCTGGYAYHGPFEHITCEDLELCSEMITTLCEAKYWEGK